ncbi:MAG: hypothetical protein JWN30_191 [Bacilli bacterium]|nr:hypothetical protein [Bacilli bacterium]
MTSTAAVLLVMSLAVTGCSIKPAATTPKKTSSGPRSLPVVTQIVKMADVGGGTVFTGSVTPQSLTNISSKISGRVTSLAVKVGDRVTTGQALATIDTTTLQQQLEQSKSSADVTAAQLTKSKDDQANSVSSAQAALNLQQTQTNKSLSDQQNTIASLKESLTVSQDQLTKAQADAANSVNTAQNTVNAQQVALQNAQAAVQNNLQSLQLQVQQNQAAYDAAQQSLNASPSNSALQSSAQAALTKLQSSQLALQQAQNTPSSTVASAQASLASAQAALQQAQNTQSVLISQEQYNQALLAVANAQSTDQGLINQSNAQLNQSATALNTAQSTDGVNVTAAQLAQSQTSIKVLSEQLQDGTLTSPVDGIVTAVNTPVGQNAGGAGGSVVSIAQVDPILATVTVPESTIGKIQVGTSMTVNVPTLNKTFAGSVLTIHPTLDPTTKSYFLDVKVDDPGHLLLPGMFTEASLKSEGRQAILVPADAILTQTNGNAVFVVQNGRSKKVLVKLGVLTSSQYEITSGLKEGDEVVVQGQELLSDNTAVQVVTADQLQKLTDPTNKTGGQPKPGSQNAPGGQNSANGQGNSGSQGNSASSGNGTGNQTSGARGGRSANATGNGNSPAAGNQAAKAGAGQ